MDYLKNSKKKRVIEKKRKWKMVKPSRREKGEGVMIEKFIRLLNSGLLSEMAHQTSSRPWFLELVPLMVLFLIAAHVLALVLSFLFFPFARASAFSSYFSSTDL